jgi:transcriptional regulator
MYIPKHFEENNQELVKKILFENPFASLIVRYEDKIEISPLPIIGDNLETLYFHTSKQNPLAQILKSYTDVTVLFHGPHAYISPDFYKDPMSTAPTWNYATVQIEGVVTWLENENDIFQFFRKMENKFKNKIWSFDQMNTERRSSLLKNISCFKMDVKKIIPKFKLSQNKIEEVDSVIANLSSLGFEEQKLAMLMKEKYQR